MGRGLLTSSVAELRVDLVCIRHMETRLAEKFVTLRNQLQESSDCLDLIGLDFDALLNEIRGKPDFTNFLQPLTKEDSRRVARDGPVVVLNASVYRGVDAILLTLNGVRVPTLPKVTLKELEQRSQKLGSHGVEILEVLEWLWDVIAKPVLDDLELTQPPPDSGTSPRVWWVPTGILTRFPLHAAGYHSRPASTDTVMDRVMPSYSSSIKALLRMHDRSYNPLVPGSTHALLVAMTMTPGWQPLTHALAEIQEIETLLKRKGCNSITLDDRTPKERMSVLQHLEGSQIFHFAGHGKENIFDPLSSALLLDDWKTNPMTVESVINLNLSEKNCFLAYLSACETGKITQQKFWDESIHLISAYQLAGFRHVIGTLWSVDDSACVEMAKETYQIIFQDGQSLADVSVCRGLHLAALTLRNETRAAMVEQQREQGISRADKRKIIVAGKSKKIQSGRTDESRSVQPVKQLWVPYVHFGV